MTNWDEIWRGTDRGSAPENAFVRFAARTYGRDMHDKMFLDIGSGTGANTAWLEQHGAEVVAIDPSHACRANHHVDARTYLLRLKVPQFDCVMDIKTLCHSREADGVYAQIHSHLKPGGWLYVMCPTIKHLNVEGGYRQVGAGKSFTRFASEWDMREMLKGFSTITIRELLEPAGDHLYTSTWCIEAQK